ncbi:FAD-dependent oxidoreductase [Mycobacterium szulgai]|uniref:FAD-dependent oxidoreductase n=1 Tax=Mycobacterium szulgai TaxID=1787 RepID=UPI001B80C475|nr:FAD-dependent oxidoreductase [Mycobacterium szulgai]MCV7077371.1 FAD-dependent oxidoreductase [Mycobacterium szulgai]
MAPRIGIIGAGPGGLSLARLLTEKGFADITVIERADRVGGKCFTLQHNGIGHELGACYIPLGYTTVKRWMKKADIGLFAVERQRISTAVGDILDFKDYVIGSKAGIFDALTQIKRYVADWRVFHNWDLHGAPSDAAGTAGRRMVDEVAEPFGKWLAERGLDVVNRLAVRSMGTMGYGSLDAVPALYGLRWNTPALFATGLIKVKEPTPGWLPLWNYLTAQLDVRLQHTVVSVDRRESGYVVHTNHGDFEFDHLVISTPLDEAAGWFPFDETERQAYPIDADTLRWRAYVTTLVDVKGWFHDMDTICWEDRVQDKAAIFRGQVAGARRTGDKTPVARARSQTRPDLYVCYQYGDGGQSDAELLGQLETDLLDDGAVVNEVLRQCRWKYSPQLQPDAIRDGAVEKMERCQGRRNLWITGATTSHETVGNIVDSNTRLVERMVMSFAGNEPSSPTALASVADQYHYRYQLALK